MTLSKAKVRGFVLLLVVLIAAAIIAVSGILPRVQARRTLAAQTNYLATPAVHVVHPRAEAPAQEVVLPGNMQAFVDAPIYARTSGYLRKWYHDIGAHVRKGELLAEIESPEVDKQLAQAREDLATALANLKLAQITAARYTDLFKSDSVAKQDVDNAVQDAAAKAAAYKSAQANVQRLQEMVGFEKLYAPFDGVVTARNTDIGQLIDSGSSGGPARELFHVAAIDRLRVFINVPQLYSHEAKRGVQADLTLPEIPNRRFAGAVARTADAIDPATRTLLVEVDVVNNTGLLFPGAYTQVHLKVTSSQPALIVPSTSLVFRSEGLRCATVVNGHAHLIRVTLGRDYGTEVEVIAGLNADSNVIVNPPDSLVDGEAVRPVAHAAPQVSE